MKIVPEDDGSVTLYFDQDVGELEQARIFLDAAHRRLAQASSIGEARALKNAIACLERVFKGGNMTAQEGTDMRNAFLWGQKEAACENRN